MLGLLSEREKKKKKTKGKRCEKMADEMQMYSLHGEVNGAKVCAEGQSPSATGDHVYAREGGIQGGGELPGRDLRLGRHLPE